VSLEKRLLQVAVAVGSLVPLSAGGAGSLLGLDFLAEPGANLSADSHFRYVSGLLLGIGLAFWSTIPKIERRTDRFRVLTFLVVVGGLARLYGLLAEGAPSGPMLFGLGMELAVTPLLCLWQGRVAGRARAHMPL